MIDEIIRRISSEMGMDEDEIRMKIEEKQAELSNLISEEGAAYIVAKELGVKFRDIEKLQITSLMPGMQNVDIIGKITKITPAKEFGTDDKKGHVVNVFIADSTGSIRLPLWNDEIEKISGFLDGDVVRVRGFIKEGLLGPELRIGKFGSIAKSDEHIHDVVVTRKADRIDISELREGMYKEIRAPLVQIFESNIFYEVCPECGMRLKEDAQSIGFKCDQHGVVEPEYNVVVSGIIDDGTGNVRVVMFNEVVEKLVGLSKKDMKRLFDQKKKISAIIERVPLGKELIFEGRARKNEFFDRLEFIANGLKSVDIKKEIEMLM